jgi:hypothetical protein
MGYIPATVLDFSGFSVSYMTNDALKSILGPWGAAVMAGILATPLTAVGERMMINKQLHKTKYSLKGAYKPVEMGVTLFREVPYNLGVYALSPEIKKVYQRIVPKANETAIDVASGFTGGALMGALSTPADLVKTRLQAGSDSLKTVLRSVTSPFAGAKERAFYIGLASSLQYAVNSGLPPKLPKMFKEI